MTTYYFLVSVSSGLNIPDYKNNLLRVDRIAKEFKTLELCITYCILYNFMCIMCSVCSNYNSRVVLHVRVLCSTVLRMWYLSESYSRHRFVPEFYCTCVGQCRSCDPPKSHPEALTECLETILINPENEIPWASLTISVIVINDVRILRHYTVKIHREYFYISVHSIPHLHTPEILLRRLSGNYCRVRILFVIQTNAWFAVAEFTDEPKR